MLRSTITAGIIALIAAFALSGGTASAKTTGKTRALTLRVTVGVVNVQARSLSIVLRMKTRAGSRCAATVSAGNLKFPLPDVVASKAGQAALKWTVEAGAPRGKWKFRVRCAKGHAFVVRVKHARISVPAGKGRPSLVAAGSIQPVAGSLATKPPAQGPGSSATGGLGAGNENPFVGYEGYCTWGAWEELLSNVVDELA